ncbi:MAG: hypothetical protein GY909_15610 [Oligoflexia bacterium]|nr:hypothetical protein [Oligoflexia bacterium]
MYILVTNASKLKRCSFEVIKERLNNNYYPIYKNTRNKLLFIEGERVCFYVGGKNSRYFGHIVAVATIARVSKRVLGEKCETEQVVGFLEFKNITYFTRPINFKKRLSILDFVPEDIQKWGVVLKGGCKKLGAFDWGALLHGIPNKSDLISNNLK